MARLTKIVRDNPISNFRQVAPDAGTGFKLLAQGMKAAYDMVEPAAVDEMKRRGLEWGTEDARRMVGDSRFPAPSDSLSLIRDFEGFREDPYWDVNAHRIGYGSDTITDVDGNVRRVQQDDRVSRADAERDLSRRVNTEFEPIARNAIGDRFDTFSPQQKAAVTSIAYNYGEIPDRIVSALQNGTPDEAADAIRALGGDNAGINRNRRNREADLFSSVAFSAREAVTVRTADGKLQGRRYSPYSGPILRAHDAAAQVAFQAEVLNKASVDLLDLSQQFLLDPEGFTEAAQGYVDSMVERAPEEFAPELDQILTKEVSRRRLGIMEDKQRDIRARADNSSRALMDRWSTAYAEALASGDPYEVSEAQQQLDSILQAREALPGVAWTDEQSANVFLDAERAADKLISDQAKERSSQYKDAFNLITDAAKAGRRAAGEEILQNPEAVAMHPDLAGQAQAFVNLRDGMPDFLQMTPNQQAAGIAKATQSKVTQSWQLDVLDAANDVATANRKAWDADPVKRASEVFPDRPPPSLPDLTPDDPDKFVSALTARRKYMDDISAQGFTQTQAYLSEEEAASIGAMMGKDIPAEVRAAMAGAIVSGFGDAAVKVFDEIDADPVTMFSGKLMAVGGRSDVAAAMLRGQQMLDEGLVMVPPKSDRIASFDTQLATAFDGIPGALGIQSELLPAAVAIYASRARGVDPNSDAATTLLSESVQVALGQAKNKRGELTGGIQTVAGFQTLLPVGVPGKAADAALRASLGEMPHGNGFLGGLANIGAMYTGDMTPGDVNAAAWAEAGGVPMINGKPMPRNLISKGQLRVIPVQGNLYRMEVGTGATRMHVEDPDGNVLYFDFPKLIEAMQ